MDLKNNLSDQGMVLSCIRAGLKAIDIADYLNVNPSTITKVQSGKIKSFKLKLHGQLILLYEFVKFMSQNAA
jgi:hypothetical protein